MTDIPVTGEYSCSHCGKTCSPVMMIPPRPPALYCDGCTVWACSACFETKHRHGRYTNDKHLELQGILNDFQIVHMGLSHPDPAIPAANIKECSCAMAKTWRSLAVFVRREYDDLMKSKRSGWTL